MAVRTGMALRRVVHGSLALLIAIATVTLPGGLDALALWTAQLAGTILAVALARRATWSTERWDDHLASRREADRRVLRANVGVRWRPPFS